MRTKQHKSHYHNTYSACLVLPAAPITLFGVLPLAAGLGYYFVEKKKKSGGGKQQANRRNNNKNSNDGRAVS